MVYDNGFDCDGVHYVRYKRSSGSSRVGKCLFVDEKMYSRLHRYDLCGLKVREGDKIDQKIKKRPVVDHFLDPYEPLL